MRNSGTVGKWWCEFGLIYLYFSKSLTVVARKGKISAMFELKKRILGCKEKASEPSAIQCQKTKIIISKYW